MVSSMSTRRMLAVLLTVLIIFALAAAAESNPAASPQGETKSQPELVTADTPRTTPGGAAFTVPTGWSITTAKNMVVLSPPETDTHIVIADSKAADAKAAVSAAWTAYRPDFTRP